MKINDKVLHIGVSALISAILFWLTGDTILTVVLSFVVGIGKEVIDIKTTGFDINDLLADLVGIGLGILITRGLLL